MNPIRHFGLLITCVIFAAIGLDDVDARMPKLNPDFDLSDYQRLKDFDKFMQWGPFEDRRPLEDDEKILSGEGAEPPGRLSFVIERFDYE